MRSCRRHPSPIPIERTPVPASTLPGWPTAASTARLSPFFQKPLSTPPPAGPNPIYLRPPSPASLQRRAYPVPLTASPLAGRNNACLTPAATPDSGPNCSPTPSPSRRAFQDIMASLDVQPRLMERGDLTRHPGPDEGGSSQNLAANALRRTSVVK
ncbi:unnamed protein product [Boreogadus saida]